ncbi:hypothetical protein RI129_002960 [Pyrocoelia pectoralis]|uniref:Mutator-like transposase domain-containing protein n=1 Tax=Pyrocoelia pectoralis TaxID=417401 RepID=A0AAN7ZUE3_9COLE
MSSSMAAVIGTVSIGIGHTQVTELFASLDIPNMCDKTYGKLHAELSQKIDEQNTFLMKEAALEEAQIATEFKEVNGKQIPIVSVVVDGAWSKRSYRSNYSALSGVACIIGAKSKKIIYMGVRNKHCFICNRQNNKDHDCYKNWNGTSTAMEASIILEGFKTSIPTNNLIHGKLIGDGDSSVFKKLNEAAPYGPTYTIEKLECRNHLLRNYITKISELSKESQFPITIRKQITSSDVLGRLRNAVTKAIAYRKNTTEPLYMQVELLKKDIENGPLHVFGNHLSCASYFCTKSTEKVISTIQF